MARLESGLRAQLKLPASLIDRTHASATSTESAPARTRRSTRIAKKLARKPALRSRELKSRKTPAPRNKPAQHKTKSVRTAHTPRKTSTARKLKSRSAQ
jgi:hypothetical protein